MGILNGIFLFIEKKITIFKKLNYLFKISFCCFVVFNLWVVFRIQDFNIMYEFFKLFYSNLEFLFIKENILLLIFTIIAIFSQNFDNYSYLKKKAANINLNYALPIIFLIIALGLSFNSGTSGKFIYFDF